MSLCRFFDDRDEAREFARGYNYARYRDGRCDTYPAVVVPGPGHVAELGIGDYAVVDVMQAAELQDCEPAQVVSL